VLGTVDANGMGYAELDVTVPASVPVGTTVFAQALADQFLTAELSEVVVRRVRAAP
jgi:hypothetical protein